jgi:cytochrome c-type biogenesis protein CcmH/NrfG
MLMGKWSMPGLRAWRRERVRVADASSTGLLTGCHEARFLRLMAALVFLGSGLLGGAGCVSRQGASGWAQPGTESFLASLRPASGDTSRLISNARYYQLMGRPDLALKQLEEAYRQDPKNLRVVNTLAQSYENLGEFERARKLYHEAQLQDYHPVLSNNACFSYYLEGKWDQAATCFRQVLARDPGNTAARNNLGLIWCRQGRLAEAHHLWAAAEGEKAAAAKLGQALAALGMEPGEIQARLHQVKLLAGQPSGTPATPRKVSATSPAGPPGTRPATGSTAAGRTTAGVKGQPPGKNLALPPHIAYQKNAAAQEAATPPDLRPAPSRKPLSCAELVGTPIEVRNGTWTRNLAHQTRSLLSEEGFSVARIGNHIDFGADRTIIYYRAGADRVAQTLRADFFPEADLKVSSKLKKGVAIKIILGHDLLQRPQLMARLAGEGK